MGIAFKVGKLNSGSASRWHLHGQAALFFACLQLSGCGLTGGALEKAARDPAIVTGSVTSGTVIDPAKVSDEATVRNAVSSANLEQIGPKPLAWANMDTGSRGTVSRITEAEFDGKICRKFETSRESFDGIALFEGRTCLGDKGQWSMLSFDAL